MLGSLKNSAEFEGIRLEKLPDWQLGWLAGFMDGEGCINIGKTGKVRVFVTSTMPIGSILQWMTGIGGVAAISRVNPKHKPAYRWEVCSIAAVYKLLSTLSPYLLLKQKQCELMLKYCKERLEEGYSNKPPDRESYIKEMHELNKRGVQDQ